jgi:hypothetical protein
MAALRHPLLERNAARIKAAGPLRGDPAGGLWLVEADSAAAVDVLVKEDPFWPTGLRRSVRVLAGLLRRQAPDLAHVPAKWTPVRRQEHARMKLAYMPSRAAAAAGAGVASAATLAAMRATAS